MKLIEKLGVAKFKVTTPELPDQELTLDFNPIIEQFDLDTTKFLSGSIGRVSLKVIVSGVCMIHNLIAIAVECGRTYLLFTVPVDY